MLVETAFLAKLQTVDGVKWGVDRRARRTQSRSIGRLRSHRAARLRPCGKPAWKRYSEGKIPGN